MKAFGNTFVGLLIFLPLQVVAEHVPDLIEPVTGVAATQVAAENDYYVRLNAYFAKRHRIIRVNTDVLFREPRLRIQLFDGESVLVQRKNLAFRAHETMFSWDGRLVNPPLEVQDLLVAGVEEEVAREAFDALTTIRIVGSKYAIDTANRRSRSLASVDTRFETSVPGAVETSSIAEVFEISTEIASLADDEVYRIEPIDSDRRFHVLLEVDPAKSITEYGSTSGGPRDAEERTRRLEQFRLFKESLGTPPEADHYDGADR